MNACLDAALRYLGLGLSVIPVRREDKRPYLPWKAYQVSRATEAEVITWFKKWPDAGVAIICGRISGLVAVDCDPRNGNGLSHIEHRLPPTPTVETGGGGQHFFFTTTTVIQKVPSLLPGVDLQGDASYAIAPPSIHPNGRTYRWLPGRAIGEVAFSPLPDVIRQLVVIHTRRDDDERSLTSRREGAASPLTIDGVLPSLKGVRRCGNGWVARCPAHADREPSLSIGIGSDGRVLLFCHAGCAFLDILAALGGGHAIARR